MHIVSNPSMNRSVIGIMDLPDEIICIIWNNLNNIDVLYSFIGVNKRFDKLARDSIYTRSIQLTETNEYCSLPDLITDRFCLDILPRIDQCIECLTLGPIYMERILHSGNYSRLCKLTFTKISEDFVFRHFNYESSLISTFRNNITHLRLTFNRNEMTSLTYIDIGKHFLPRIFHTFSNLLDLDFNQNSIEGRTIISIYGLSSITCYSLSLINLSVTVKTFDDCLCLLDGRFRQLCKLCVTIDEINTPLLIIEDLKILSNMKYFSLTSYSDTTEYDSYIVPLIRQMIYLEELTLYIKIQQRSTFIDGTHLENEILVHLSHLQIFKFDIITHAESMSNEMYIQSNKNIQRTFVNWRYGPVNCYISHYPKNVAKCHIFSLPLSTTHIFIIACGFQGDRDTSVRRVYLSDRIYPFKHEFFLRIAHALPFLTHLNVFNNRTIPDNIDETNNQMAAIVEFHHLICLKIHFQRSCYVEQFLVDTNTYLPNLIDLTVSYDNLVTVSQNFTRNATRRNCSKIQTLTFTISVETVHSQEFYLHFPCLKSLY